MKNETNDLLVSVAIITYNHEQFIDEAIKSVLMQKCDYPIELIISDDCSIDSTESVIRKAIQNNPNRFIVKYFRQPVNLGMHSNFMFAINECQGKYLAFCEGDDFWINEHKLQKQIDYLENDNACGMVFSNAQMFAEENVPNGLTPIKENRYYTGKEILTSWIVPTPSVMIRKRDYLKTKFLELPLHQFLYCDNILFAKMSEVTNVFGSTEYLVAYRRLLSGVSMSVIYEAESLKKRIKNYKLMRKYLSSYFKPIINFHISNLYLWLFQRKGGISNIWNHNVSLFKADKFRFFSIRHFREDAGVIYRRLFVK